MNYTREYFIKKFEGIPEGDIGTGSVSVSHCAIWHCGVRLSDDLNLGGRTFVMTEEAKALANLLHPPSAGELSDNEVMKAIWTINDGYGSYEELGKTPRQRILKRLRSLA